MVALSYGACLTMKPLAKGASVDIEPSGCFRYILELEDLKNAIASSIGAMVVEMPGVKGCC